MLICFIFAGFPISYQARCPRTSAPIRTWRTSRICCLMCLKIRMERCRWGSLCRYFSFVFFFTIKHRFLLLNVSLTACWVGGRAFVHVENYFTKETPWLETVFGVEQWQAAQATVATQSVFFDTHCSPWERPCFKPPRFFCTKQSARVETGAFPWRVGGGKFCLRVSNECTFCPSGLPLLQLRRFAVYLFYTELWFV